MGTSCVFTGFIHTEHLYSASSRELLRGARIHEIKFLSSFVVSS